MKGVYRADAQTKAFVSSDLVPDDYVLQANETFENPSGKVTPAKLSGATWLDATSEEHQAYLDQMQKDFLAQHPEAAQLAQPSQPADDKGTEALNALGKQVGKLVTDSQKNAQALQALGAQVASIIAKDSTKGVK